MNGRPLRLLVTMPFYTLRHGGSVAQAHLRCRELARRGHRVRVLTSDLAMPAGAATGRFEPFDGYEVCALRTAPWHRVPPYLPPNGFAALLGDELRTCDLLLLHVGLTLGGARAGRAAAQAGVPFLYNGEGCLDPVRLRVRRLGKALFLRVYERPLLRRAAAVQVVAAAERAHVLAQGAAPARIHQIANMVDEQAWPGGDGPAFRAAHGLPAAAVVVLFAGRLAPLKGVDLLLTALLPRLHADPSLHVVLAGPDDGAGAALRSRAAAAGMTERVRCIGPLAPAALRDAFAGSDLFALTSRSEGLPNAALEAAAAGLPLWLSDACNLPEAATDGAGVVAPPDANELLAAAMPLLTSAERRRTAGARARAMVHTRFSVPAITDRLELLYRNIARRG